MAVDRARRLLQQHHGGGTSNAMPQKDDGWKTWDGHPAVLRGPKAPFWICSTCTAEGNWACRICCRECGAAPAPTRRREAIARHKEVLAKEKAAGGARREGTTWSKNSGESAHWREAIAPNANNWSKDRSYAEAPRELSKVEKALTYLQAAKDAGADAAAIESAEGLLAEARLARDKATPPLVARKRLEQRIAGKVSAVAKAKDASQAAQEAVVAAQEAAAEAIKRTEERERELAKLQAELDTLEVEEPAAEADVGEAWCDGEDEGLDAEFRGDIGVVRAYRRLEAAKASARAGGRPTVPEPHESSKMEEDDLNFKGEDISDDILDVLEAAETSTGDEQRLAKKARLAQFVQECSRKKLRTAGSCGVRRIHSKR